MKTVRGLVYPMPFIREIDELARNALSLQCLKKFVALTNRTAKIEIVMNDKHRCFEFTEIAR